jgi:rare lipoprotein A
MKAKFRNPFFFILLLHFVCLSGYSQVSETGMASFYSDKFEGKITASGDPYKASKLTAAHRTLPFGTRVKVTNLSNNKSVTVTVNDRGPFVDNRIIDLSKAAAEKLDYIDQGVTKVKIEVQKKPEIK